MVSGGSLIKGEDLSDLRNFCDSKALGLHPDRFKRLNNTDIIEAANNEYKQFIAICKIIKSK
jgi:hypothetical protein